MSEEHTGGSSSYYSVWIENPTTEGRPQYFAECNDIIEALNMTYAEANVFKANWRKAAERTLGLKKKGNNAVYDAEKMVFFSNRTLVQEMAKRTKPVETPSVVIRADSFKLLDSEGNDVLAQYAGDTEDRREGKEVFEPLGNPVGKGKWREGQAAYSTEDGKLLGYVTKQQPERQDRVYLSTSKGAARECTYYSHKIETLTPTLNSRKE